MRYRSSTTKEPVGFVYVMSNHSRSTLYIGVTRNWRVRVEEHKKGINPKSFTSQYNCVYLVYYEFYEFLSEAIAREKQIKKWKREWKDELVLKQNSNFRDLYFDLESGELGSDDLYF